MRERWLVAMVGALAGCPKAAPIMADASIVDAASPDVVTAAIDAAPSSSHLQEVLARADKVEAWELDTGNFADAPAGSIDRVSGYRIVKPLGAPSSAAFGNNLSTIVLAEGAYRKEAILCALGKAVGIRWTRKTDIAETTIMPPCPSVNISTNFGAHLGGQLEGEPASRVFALVRAAYPSSR